MEENMMQQGQTAETIVRGLETELPDSEKARAVLAFNQRFGEMDRVLWCLAVNSRADLLRGQASPVVEALVWTVKSWWGVQGVTSETKALMARALAAMDWSSDLFQEALPASPDAEERASDFVLELVDRARGMGVPRREFSLASKVLHWLLPWRIPVYDSFVRQYLRVPTSWDHPEAYRCVVQREYAVARLTAPDAAWVGTLAPLSPLRALDKCLWWIGGGRDSPAAQVVRNPWRRVDLLGLRRS
jgi:hypothetical protein